MVFYLTVALTLLKSGLYGTIIDPSKYHLGFILTYFNLSFQTSFVIIYMNIFSEPDDTILLIAIVVYFIISATWLGPGLSYLNEINQYNLYINIMTKQDSSNTSQTLLVRSHASALAL